MKFRIFIIALFFSSVTNAGTWLYDKDINQVEVREGNRISVVLSDSDGLCDTNRVFFQADQYINQEAVNQYLSILLMAKSTNIPVSIHVETATAGDCFGRIAFVK